MTTFSDIRACALASLISCYISAMDNALTLKHTIIGGQTAPDDWSVMLDGETVGRIHPLLGNPAAVDQWRCS